MSVYVPSLNEKDPKNVIRAVQQLSAGRSNAVGLVTLKTSVASTTVMDPNCAVGSTISLAPTTADAAAAVATTFIPPATIANGSFVIDHANNTQADRTFRYAIVG